MLWRCPDQVATKDIFVEHPAGKARAADEFDGFHWILFRHLKVKLSSAWERTDHDNHRERHHDSVRHPSIPVCIVLIPRMGEQPTYDRCSKDAENEEHSLMACRYSETQDQKDQLFQEQFRAPDQGCKENKARQPEQTVSARSFKLKRLPFRNLRQAHLLIYH